MKKMVVVLCIAAIAMSSCMWNGRRVKGNGHVVSENKQFDNFTGVDLSADFDVYLAEGPNAVKIEAEDNIMSYIEIENRNGVLEIGTKDNVWLSPVKGVKIYVTAPHFNEVALTSSGNIIGQTKITDPEKLHIDLTGSGDIKLQADAPEVTAEITGSGNINLSGEAKKFSGEIMGSGDMRAGDLKAEESKMEITGSGNADLFSSVKLTASITGSGDVRYKGNAQVDAEITGSGKVRKVD